MVNADNLRAASPWMPIDDKLLLAILGKLGEELGELVSAVNRCIIQGLDEKEPVSGKLNRDWLEEEVADVRANLFLLVTHLRLDEERMTQRSAKKVEHLTGWHKLITDLSSGMLARLLGEDRKLYTLRVHAACDLADIMRFDVTGMPQGYYRLFEYSPIKNSLRTIIVEYIGEGKEAWDGQQPVWPLVWEQGSVMELQPKKQNPAASTIKEPSEWDLIQELRAPEGASVTIICDNPGFSGSNSKIVCEDDWTGWVELMFEGDSVLDCLKKAVTAKRLKEES